MLKRIPIKLTPVPANGATFRHLDKLIGNWTARMSALLPVLVFPRPLFFFPRRNFPLLRSFPASSPRGFSISARVYSAKWLTPTVISAVSTKSKLIAAVRRMQSPGKQAFRRLAGLIVRGKLRLLVRRSRSFLYFFFCSVSGNSSHVKKQPTISQK